jgi:ankyrin repeat protein
MPIEQPKLKPTKFGTIKPSSFISFIRTGRHSLTHTNDHQQNLLHHFLIDDTHWNPGDFKSLLAGDQLTPAEKDALRSLTTMPDDQGMTPIHYAGIYGDTHWLRDLSQYSSLIRADIHSKSPIDYLLNNDDPKLLLEFVEVVLDGNINKDLGKGITLAHCIARHPLGAKFFTALTKGGYNLDMSIRDDNGNTPLMAAAAAGRIENIDAILNVVIPGQVKLEVTAKRSKEALDRLDPRSRSRGPVIPLETELTNAIAVKKREILNVVNNSSQNAVHLLVSADPTVSAAYIKTLFEAMATRGEYISARDIAGDNVAHIAARAGNLQLLLDLATDPIKKRLLNTENDLRQTPLHLLLQHKQSSMLARDPAFMVELDTLLTRMPGLLGVNVDSSGNSLVHYAAANGYYDLIPRLLERDTGAVVVHWANKDGQTPVHLAALNGHNGMLKLLLNPALGIDINAQDKNGNTALSLAAQRGDMDAMRILAQNGANPYINSKGQTVFNVLEGADKTFKTEAYALLVLNAGFTGLNKKQQVEAEQILHNVAQTFVDKLHQLSLNPSRNYTIFLTKVSTITTEFLEKYRPLTEAQKNDFNGALTSQLKPIFDDLAKLHAAKNHVSNKAWWDLIGRTIDYVSNALVVAKYTVWGMGKPEEKLLNAAKKIVNTKLHTVSKQHEHPRTMLEEGPTLARTRGTLTARTASQDEPPHAALEEGRAVAQAALNGTRVIHHPPAGGEPPQGISHTQQTGRTAASSTALTDTLRRAPIPAESAAQAQHLASSARPEIPAHAVTSSTTSPDTHAAPPPASRRPHPLLDALGTGQKSQAVSLPPAGILTSAIRTAKAQHPAGATIPPGTHAVHPPARKPHRNLGIGPRSLGIGPTTPLPGGVRTK